MGLKRIAVLGAGGQAREIEWLIRDINRSQPTYEFLGYLVADISKLGEHDSKTSLLGDESWLDQNRLSVDCLTVGVGNPHLRLEIAAKVSAKFPEISWPALIHPSAIYDRETCDVGQGVLLCARATCTANIKFGSFALINFGCTIGHEAQIGRGSVINPGANISGGVVLGDGVLIGTGAQVLQYIRIGAGATIGAGAVVVKNVVEGATMVGVPARPVKHR